MRTRSHIIEDESRLEFKKILPKVWVSRDKSIDYGIDIEVEIFDNDGNPTGKVFWVQLKATDSTNQSTITSITVTRSKLFQFISYDISILLARYSTKRKLFYVRWAKSIDLSIFKKDQKNLKIYFSQNNCKQELVMLKNGK